MHMHPGTRGVLLATALALGACQQLQNLVGAGTVAGRETGTAGPSAGATATAQRTDADMSQVINALSALGAKPIETLSVAQARQQPSFADAYRRVLQERGLSTAPRPVPQVRDISVPTPAGPIPARVYGPARGGAAVPLIVYWHGGGWVIADLDTYDASARALQAETGAVVLSLHYRQAPEHKFPAAHEDAVAAYRWAVQNARRLGADPNRLAVVGESAGGNLAINAAIAARDAGLPMPDHMVLIYPVAGTDTNTPSYRENTATAPLSRAGMLWFVDKVTRSQADLQDPRLDIVGKARLQGLPPATVVNAEHDPLRSEGETLANRLREAGVPVERRVYEGTTHEFFGMAPVVADAQAAQDFVGERLHAALGGRGRVAAR
ncbi:MAG: alpha/beta hydrolase [Acetobacteraceae bacterium]|nr:alpha/beta hydrolase [Acetobacteraceae bacterium]